jgi:hypothetical protein
MPPGGYSHRHRVPTWCSGGEEARTLPVPEQGAQRASSHHSRPVKLAILGLAAAFAIGTLAVTPAPAAAAGVKVVVVVGPVSGHTSDYIYNAKKYAAQARSYGATVTEIYSPYATWSKVKSAAQGANILIYLGHGNGYPSPYGAFSAYTRDGMGLNATSGNGNNNNKYYGEFYIRNYINLAPNAVVILNRLCYASGNSEPGRANPTKSVAMQRVDNFGAGFLRANAKAVFAIGTSSATYTLKALLTESTNISKIFRYDSSGSFHYDFWFYSKRTSGARIWMDPSSPGRYYRSVVGNFLLMTDAVRAG